MGTPADSASTSGASRFVHSTINILLAVLFVLLALASYRQFVETQSIRSFGLLAVNTLVLALFLGRRKAKAETTHLSLWLLGVAGTALPLLLRPGEALGLPRIGSGIQLVGIILLAGGLLSLRRSFAIVPGNRGVRDNGLYRIVRHPIYLSELIAFLGAVLASPTIANWIVWICECGVQYARARAEEKFLSADPAYRAYRGRVRYRLIPGLL